MTLPYDELDTESLNRLLEEHRVNLKVWIEQATKHGKLYAPANLSHQINDTKQEMALIRSVIASRIDNSYTKNSLDNSQKVFYILSNIQDVSKPLTQSITELLSFAKSINNQEVITFCKQELIGYKNVNLDAFQYRLAKGFGSLEQIDTRRSNRVDDMFFMMSNSERFSEMLLPIYRPISEIENIASQKSENSLLIFKLRLGDISPDVENPDQVAYWYGKPESFEDILSNIRVKLIEYVIDI